MAPRKVSTLEENRRAIARASSTQDRGRCGSGDTMVLPMPLPVAVDSSGSAGRCGELLLEAAGCKEPLTPKSFQVHAWANKGNYRCILTLTTHTPLN